MEPLREAGLAALVPLLGTGRRMIGIAGPPGAGKSTLAGALAAALVERAGPDAAVVVPMDGFHLSNEELARLGLADRKGAPETFDAAGFVALLHRLRAAEPLVYAPSYSRVLHESIGGAVPVTAAVELVIVEGNYLLLESGDWARVRGLLDLAIYLDAPAGLRIEGLLRRQRSRGLSRASAYDWVHRSDEANAALVAAGRHRADLILTRLAVDPLAPPD